MYHGMFGKNVPLNVIMQKARHEDLKTTSDYLRVNNDVVREYEKM